MLKLEFTDMESFFEWIEEENPPGERYFTSVKDREGYVKVIAVVQSSRRRAYVVETVPEDEYDEITEKLAELDFFYVTKIEGLK